MNQGSARGGGAVAPNERAVDLRQKAGAYCKTLVESFATLLRESKMETDKDAAHAAFQINVATADLVTSGEGLLRLIQELKLSILLQDVGTMTAEVEAREAELRQAREGAVGQVRRLTEVVQAANTELLEQK